MTSGEIPRGLGGSSLAAVHFPYQPGTILNHPGIASDPNTCDVALRTEVLPLALILEDVHIITTHGGLTPYHGGEALSFFKTALQRAVHRIQGYR